jgi:hypothetical protein
MSRAESRAAAKKAKEFMDRRKQQSGQSVTVPGRAEQRQDEKELRKQSPKRLALVNDQDKQNESRKQAEREKRKHDPKRSARSEKRKQENPDWTPEDLEGLHRELDDWGE